MYKIGLQIVPITDLRKPNLEEHLDKVLPKKPRSPGEQSIFDSLKSRGPWGKLTGYPEQDTVVIVDGIKRLDYCKELGYVSLLVDVMPKEKVFGDE